jgi:hypothetical protein
VNSAPLYHATGFGSAVSILKQDVITGTRNRTEIRGRYEAGVSFTRSLVFAVNWAPVVFEFNQDKMRQKMKLFPYVDRYQQMPDEQHVLRKEAEEFHIGDFFNMSQFLTGIYINRQILENLEKYSKKTSSYESMMVNAEIISQNPKFIGYVNKTGKLLS